VFFLRFPCGFPAVGVFTTRFTSGFPAVGVSLRLVFSPPALLALYSTFRRDAALKLYNS
jgi:hypothetical protein